MPTNVCQRSQTLNICFDVFLGGGYAKSQAPLLITKTNEAEFQAERVIPIPVEKAKTKKLKADDFSIKPVNPLISKATLRGMVIVK